MKFYFRFLRFPKRVRLCAQRLQVFYPETVGPRLFNHLEDLWKLKKKHIWDGPAVFLLCLSHCFGFVNFSNRS